MKIKKRHPKKLSKEAHRLRNLKKKKRKKIK